MLNKKKSFIDKIPNWGWLCISLATAAAGEATEDHNQCHHECKKLLFHRISPYPSVIFAD